MNDRMKRFGVGVMLVAMGFFVAFPFWKWLHARSVSNSLYERTKALVEKNPQLQPAWAIAIQDGVLTYPEAKVIVEAAGEKIEPEK
jgi:hypothetical protein